MTVPTGDVELIRWLADHLRAGGEQAARLRAAMDVGRNFRPAQTGDELLAFFRSSPLIGIGFERDRSPGRPIEL